MKLEDWAAVDRTWRLAAAAAIVSVLLFSVVFGFLLLPVIQGRAAGIDAFTSICRALGIAPGAPSAPQPASDAKAQPTTRVAWSDSLMQSLASPDAGATKLAAGCATCHGAEGRSTNPQLYPDLAGQSAAAIYKQLLDFKTGSRVNALMSPMAQPLTDDQMAGLAAHFASFPVRPLPPAQLPAPGADIERLVARGDPARALPPCNSCHGDQSGGPVEAPRLTHQSLQYLQTQLRAFKTGERRNDIYARMRSVAEKLKLEEIDGLAAFYSTTLGY
jgi:cytochrome c553